MTAVVENFEFNEGGFPFLQIADVTVTTDGDTFQSKFKSVKSVAWNNRTTAGVTKVAVSSGTLTITCTSGDRVDLWILGDTN